MSRIATGGYDLENLIATFGYGRRSEVEDAGSGDLIFKRKKDIFREFNFEISANIQQNKEVNFNILIGIHNKTDLKFKLSAKLFKELSLVYSIIGRKRFIKDYNLNLISAVRKEFDYGLGITAEAKRIINLSNNQLTGMLLRTDFVFDHKILTAIKEKKLDNNQLIKLLLKAM